MNDNKMLNETLRLIRLVHGLKGKELALKLGVSPSYLSEIESAKKTPSIELLLKYSQVLNIHLSTLLFFAEEMDRRTTVGKIKASLREWLFALVQMINERANKGTGDCGEA